MGTNITNHSKRYQDKIIHFQTRISYYILKDIPRHIQQKLITDIEVPHIESEVEHNKIVDVYGLY